MPIWFLKIIYLKKYLEKEYTEENNFKAYQDHTILRHTLMPFSYLSTLLFMYKRPQNYFQNKKSIICFHSHSSKCIYLFLFTTENLVFKTYLFEGLELQMLRKQQTQKTFCCAIQKMLKAEDQNHSIKKVSKFFGAYICFVK